MASPLELRALGSNREVSTGKLWAWRVFFVVVMANVSASVSGGTVEFAGAIVGAGGVLFAILYALGEEQPETNDTAEEASAA